MQTLLANKLKLINNNTELGKKFPKEVIPYLLSAVENADAKLKIDIENQIVKIGEAAIPVLIESLISTKGAARGVAAMSLIRLGSASINPLRDKKEIKWIVDYIINEIEGSKELLTKGYETSKYQEVLVG